MLLEFFNSSLTDAKLCIKNLFRHALLIILIRFTGNQSIIEKVMADSVADSALKYLGDPAMAAGLGAVALASMYYLASRPTPQPCPVDPQQQSYELPVTIL